MRILLTGASGFLGKVISLNLSSFDLMTLGRDSKSDIVCNIAKEIPVLPAVDLLIHAAGKAHIVPATPAESQDFFDVNVSGTQHLLTGLERAGIPKYFVFISSVAVYGRATGQLIGEDASLEAADPYGLSKIEAEKMIRDWCEKNNVVCTIFRLPLLAGTNPPGNLKAMIKGINKGYYFDIGGGKARKSIVLATDVADLIPKAALIGGVFNLTDRCHPEFSEISFAIATQMGKSQPLNIPLWMARLVAVCGDLLGKRAPLNSDKLKKITSDLTFDDTKAVRILNWSPVPVITGFKIK